MQIPPPEIGADEARRAADQVLAGRAYVEASRPPSLQERLFDWVAEQFSNLFNALSSGGSRGIIAWLIIAIFVGAIVYLLSKLLSGFSAVPTPRIQPDVSVEVIGELSEREWLAAAATAEESGDFRQGIRCRHRALVTALVEHGIVRAGPDQTAGEIQDLFAQTHPGAAGPMQQATWLFKDTWYGWTVADAAARDSFAGLAAQVQAQSKQPEPELVAT